MPPHGAVDPGSVWSVQYMICPECENFIAELRLTDVATSQLVKGAMVWPLHHVRPVAPEVDSAYADDYSEAAAILGISPKASAALSRRLVQHVIREKAGIKKGSLDEEITMLIGAGVLPGWLASNVDAIRAVGNFAAHPIKSTNTGEVVEVEPGEAEFLLDVLDDLFDFYFVQPEKAKQHLAGINAKLADAGKPALKQVPPAGTTSP
ncbi:MAG TPA: DUF4145 domain-containing protein [Gaiellaceae bacterium]|jgi:hypothetical protein